MKDRRRDYRYYLCRHTAAFEVPTGRQVRCTGRHWPAGLLDGAVWQAVRERLAVVPAGGLPDAAEQHRTEREALAHALRQRLSEEERYLRLFAAGHITAEERLRRLLEPVRAAVASLRERLLALERSGWACGRPGAQTPDRTGEGMTGRPELNALPAGVRRELVRLLVREAVVGEGGLLIHVIPNPDRQLGR